MAIEESGLSFGDAVKWVGAAAAAMIAFFLKRVIGVQDRHGMRLDLLERNTVSMEVHEKSLDKLEAKMDAHRAESTKSFDRLFERLDTIADRLPK